ncbi:MAG TPA: hypothetical protein VGR69_01785 [Candidatus Rubrimentiphilum sp.]|nr:hypothetical protein [Candidatus Rubrimentiphilum sp.]
MQIFAALPVYIGGPLFIGVFVAFGILAGLLVHRFVPRAVFEEHNEIAGFMFAVVGVVYAVLLAFLAIAVWERYEAAEVRTYDEANQLSVVYRAVDVFPQAPKIRKDLMRYTTLVINDEWPKMNGSGESSEANLLLEDIGYDIRHLHANTPSQQAVLSSLLENIHSIMVDRDYRISMSSEGINVFVWTILFAGAIGTMLFASLFAFKRAGAQVAMTGLLAFSLAIVLYLISVMDFPFRGEVRIGPEAFVNAAHTYCDVGC